MRTNIILDDNLIEEAFKYSNVKTKKALISLALQDYYKYPRGMRSLKKGIEFCKCVIYG